MTDILDLIDNATEQRCACGCGTRLDPDGPSAWFASEWCQKRWNEARAGLDDAGTRVRLTTPFEIPEHLLNDRIAAEDEWVRRHITGNGTSDGPRGLLAGGGLPEGIPPRAPVIEEPRPGYRLAPFVGGPWHGDLRNVPHGETGWSAADWVAGPEASFREVLYTRRRAWVAFEPDQPVMFGAFCTSDATQNELVAVCGNLICAGWRPA